MGSARGSLGRGLGALLVSGVMVAACAGASSGDPGSTSGTAVKVEASEYRFEPGAVTVPAGEVVFAVTNVGTVEHEFEIFLGDRVVDEVEGLVPGLTRELRVTLEPGSYTYVCKLAGHEEQGMKGALTVTAP